MPTTPRPRRAARGRSTQIPNTKPVAKMTEPRPNTNGQIDGAGNSPTAHAPSARSASGRSSGRGGYFRGWGQRDPTGKIQGREPRPHMWGPATTVLLATE